MKSLLRCRFIYLLPLFLLLINKVNGQDFEVAPVKLEFDSEPGSNQTKTVNVKNHSNKKVSFIIAVGDFLPSISGERKYMAPNSTKRSCANWLNINPTFFELNPGDEVPVQIGMMVPNDQYGAAWCMIYIQPTREQTTWSADKKLGAGVMISGRIGVLIYQSPKSNTNHSVKISNLTEITKATDKERVFSATIENLGDKITKCKAYLIASNMKTAEEKQFPSIDVETFPKMSRTVEFTLPNVLTPGSYSLAAILDYGSKYSLEGTQLLIDIKDQTKAITPDTSHSKIDTVKVR